MAAVYGNGGLLAPHGAVIAQIVAQPAFHTTLFIIVGAAAAPCEVSPHLEPVDQEIPDIIPGLAKALDQLGKTAHCCTLPSVR